LIAQKTVVLCPDFLTTDPKQIPDYNPLEGDIADRGCVGESVWPIKVG